MEKIHFKRSQLINIVSIIGLIATVILILIAYRTGILTSSEKLAKFTKSIGILGVIFFVFLQIVHQFGEGSDIAGEGFLHFIGKGVARGVVHAYGGHSRAEGGAGGDDVVVEEQAIFNG